MRRLKSYFQYAAVLLCVLSLVSCFSHTDEANTHPSNAQGGERDTLSCADLGDMTGEEIRVAYLRGEISVEDMFLSSDIAYIQTKLDELFRHYTAQADAHFLTRNSRLYRPAFSLVRPLPLTTAKSFPIPPSHSIRSN